MNEERFIEKLLRRYARKRQAEAGPPMTLHPATRRLLQAEVARRYGEAASGTEPAPSFWAWLWRRWGRPLAWVTPVVVAGAVVVWVWVGKQPSSDADLSGVSDSKAGHAAGLVENRSHSDSPAPQLSDVSQAEPPQPTLARVASAEPKRPAEKSVRASPGAPPSAIAESLRALETPPPLPPLPDNEATRGDRSLWEVTPPSEPSVGGGLQLGFAWSEVNKPAAAGQEQTATAVAAAPAPAAANILSQAFVNAAAGLPGAGVVRARAAASRPAASGHAAAPVLSRFQILQIGNEIRVLDADGSVYLAKAEDQISGDETAGSGEAAAAGIFKRKPESAPQTDHLKTASGQSVAVPLLSTQLSQSQQIRAVGTNRTLNQQVEFVWNFAPLTNGPPTLRGQAVSAPALPALQNLSLPLPPSVGIVGWARIGQTQQVEVRAVPENSR